MRVTCCSRSCEVERAGAIKAGKQPNVGPAGLAGLFPPAGRLHVSEMSQKHSFTAPPAAPTWKTICQTESSALFPPNSRQQAIWWIC